MEHIKRYLYYIIYIIRFMTIFALNVFYGSSVSQSVTLNTVRKIEIKSN